MEKGEEKNIRKKRGEIWKKTEEGKHRGKIGKKRENVQKQNTGSNL